MGKHVDVTKKSNKKGGAFTEKTRSDAAQVLIDKNNPKPEEASAWGDIIGWGAAAGTLALTGEPTTALAVKSGVTGAVEGFEKGDMGAVATNAASLYGTGKGAIGASKAAEAAEATDLMSKYDELGMDGLDVEEQDMILKLTAKAPKGAALKAKG